MMNMFSTVIPFKCLVFKLSQPYFKNKIGCIKDSYVPQEQSHT